MEWQLTGGSSVIVVKCSFTTNSFTFLLGFFCHLWNPKCFNTSLLRWFGVMIIGSLLQFRVDKDKKNRLIYWNTGWEEQHRRRWRMFLIIAEIRVTWKRPKTSQLENRTPTLSAYSVYILLPALSSCQDDCLCINVCVCVCVCGHRVRHRAVSPGLTV